MNEATVEWVDKAENDFDAAHLAMRRERDEPPLADIVCFHSQQVAEKYLKAFLQERDVRFERQHALEPLLDQCAAMDGEFEALRRDLRSLDGYAVAVRYPGAKPSAEAAERALASATRLRSLHPSQTSTRPTP